MASKKQTETLPLADETPAEPKAKRGRKPKLDRGFAVVVVYADNPPDVLMLATKDEAIETAKSHARNGEVYLCKVLGMVSVKVSLS